MGPFRHLLVEERAHIMEESLNGFMPALGPLVLHLTVVDIVVDIVVVIVYSMGQAVSQIKARVVQKRKRKMNAK